MWYSTLCPCWKEKEKNKRGGTGSSILCCYHLTSVYFFSITLVLMQVSEGIDFSDDNARAVVSFSPSCCSYSLLLFYYCDVVVLCFWVGALTYSGMHNMSTWFLLIAIKHVVFNLDVPIVDEMISDEVIYLTNLRLLLAFHFPTRKKIFSPYVFSEMEESYAR